VWSLVTHFLLLKTPQPHLFPDSRFARPRSHDSYFTLPHVTHLHLHSVYGLDRSLPCTIRLFSVITSLTLSSITFHQPQQLIDLLSPLALPRVQRVDLRGCRWWWKPFRLLTAEQQHISLWGPHQEWDPDPVRRRQEEERRRREREESNRRHRRELQECSSKCHEMARERGIDLLLWVTED
jgi:hypothetical protein